MRNNLKDNDEQSKKQHTMKNIILKKLDNTLSTSGSNNTEALVAMGSQCQGDTMDMLQMKDVVMMIIDE